MAVPVGLMMGGLDAHPAIVPALIAFFVLYSTIVFFFNLVNRKKSTLLELLGLLINAGIFFVTSYVLVEEVYGKEWVAAADWDAISNQVRQVLSWIEEARG